MSQEISQPRSHDRHRRSLALGLFLVHRPRSRVGSRHSRRSTRSTRRSTRSSRSITVFRSKHGLVFEILDEFVEPGCHGSTQSGSEPVTTSRDQTSNKVSHQRLPYVPPPPLARQLTSNDTSQTSSRPPKVQTIGPGSTILPYNKHSSIRR